MRIPISSSRGVSKTHARDKVEGRIRRSRLFNQGGGYSKIQFNKLKFCKKCKNWKALQWQSHIQAVGGAKDFTWYPRELRGGRIGWRGAGGAVGGVGGLGGWVNPNLKYYSLPSESEGRE